MGLFAIRILSVFALLLNGIFPPFQMVSATPRAQGTVIETVRKGDTLQKVALRYRTDWKHLKRINGLTRNGLVPGQSLLVPGTRLKIRNGDSAWDISLRHGLNLRQLKKANPGKRLSSLRPGTWLEYSQPRKRNISTGQFFVRTGVPEKATPPPISTGFPGGTFPYSHPTQRSPGSSLLRDSHLSNSATGSIRLPGGDQSDRPRI